MEYKVKAEKRQPASVGIEPSAVPDSVYDYSQNF
jgi:hypothetical protein